MVKLSDTLAWKEQRDFLSDYCFRLALDEDGDNFSCTVVENSEFLLAFTYQQGLGKNFMVAELGCPVCSASIAARKNGWSLISEVWPNAHDQYNKLRNGLPYPYKLSDIVEKQVIDEMLRTFVEKVRSKEVTIGKPGHRIEEK